MPMSEQQFIASVRIVALHLTEAGLPLAKLGTHAPGLVRVGFVENATEQLGLL